MGQHHFITCHKRNARITGTVSLLSKNTKFQSQARLTSGYVLVVRVLVNRALYILSEVIFLKNVDVLKFMLACS